MENVYPQTPQVQREIDEIGAHVSVQCIKKVPKENMHPLLFIETIATTVNFCELCRMATSCTPSHLGGLQG